MSIAPGPGLAALAWLPRLRRDPLGTMLALHDKYGDIVRLGDGRLTAHLLGHPRHAEHVLRRRHANYDRQTRSADAVRQVTGESLLTNDGEQWRRHRLLMQPLFNRNALGALPAIVNDATHAMIDAWLARGDVDVAAEMMRLTSTIASRAFFGTDVDEDLAALMPVILEETYDRATSIFGRRKASRDFAAACGGVRTAVARILERGDSPLLAQLRALPFEELRNETIALLLAGHETTANALAWTFALLAHEERRRLGGRTGGESPPLAGGTPAGQPAPTPAFHAAAVQEAMRLYPPIWIVERRAIEADAIDGFTIPAQSSVYVSPYVLHRHREFWNEAERFDPSRFPAAAQNGAYLPFGIGPHACLGSAFAMIEAPLVVDAVRERCTIELLEEKTEPQAWITLRPRNGLRARIRSAARPPARTP
jgi:enediyne biosynthesis protein E7